MTKEEKRKYYRAFRAIGGFMLFLSNFTSIYTASFAGVLIVTYAIFNNSFISHFVSEFAMYGMIVYTYYVGYRIFFKKYLMNNKLEFLVDKKNYFKMIFDIIFVLIVTRFTWIVWSKFLEMINYNVANTSKEIYLFGILYVTIIAPVAEEIVFRGMILKILKEKYNVLLAIIISSLAFGIFHGTFLQSVPAIFLGILFSFLTIKYNSLIPGVIVHILSNIISMVEVFWNIPNIVIFENIIILFSIAIIIYFIIMNLSKIKNLIKNLIYSFKLIFHSISFMLFLISYILIITLDALNGIYHFIN